MRKGHGVEDVLARRRESKSLEFKRSFEVGSAGAWCELVKDIAAIANSGGGHILIGVDNNGEPTGEDVSEVLGLDGSAIMDKLKQYTGTQSVRVELSSRSKKGYPVPVLEIGSVTSPLVFVRPGTYPVSDRQQKTAFSRGQVYFRHGAKSEPANPEDLEAFIAGELVRRRDQLLANVRRVVEAPEGHDVVVVRAGTAGALSVAAVPRDRVPNGSPVIAIEDSQRFHTLIFTDVARLTGVKGNHLTAVMRELGIRDDPSMAYCTEYGRQRIWKYSYIAVRKIQDELPGLNLQALLKKHVTSQARRRRV